MNQYIITEKLADEVSEILLRADRQPNKHALVKLLHSHPYQSRDKVLDELVAWREKQDTGKCYEKSDWFDLWLEERDFIKELRQAGSP